MEQIEQHSLKSIIERYESANFTVTRRIHAKIKERLPDGLTIDQCSILRYLKQEPNLTTTELADVFGVGKSTITAIITRLVDKGLVERRQSTADRRIIYLDLTANGLAIIGKINEEVRQILTPYLGCFTMEVAMQFVEVFEKLASLLQMDHESIENEGNSEL